MNNLCMKVKSIILVSCIILLQACVSKAGNAEHKSYEALAFAPVDNPMAVVQSTLDKAKKHNKLALLVLGAQWCHDSTGLAQRFETPEMKTVLDNHYEMVFIDVGYFQDRRNITQRFGQAHYFATPTVLVVEPNTEQLLNGHSLAKWGAADSLSLNEYIEYFSGFNSTSTFEPNFISEQHKIQIKQFEKQQSMRLMAAYIVLRPELKTDAERAPGSDYDEGFVQRWREVRKFRIQLQKDIQQLYVQANKVTDEVLELPVYGAFTWD